MTDETINELKTWIEFCKLMAALEEEKTADNVGAKIRQEAIAETFRRIAGDMSAKVQNVKRRRRKVKP